MTTPANWYPDPNGRADFRYWDGKAWTVHVSTDGVQSTDPVEGGVSRGPDQALSVGNEGRTDKIQQQLTGQGIRGAGLTGKVEGGGGTILTEPVLVVNQKAKLIELNNQYSVFGQDGQQLAMVNQVGQSAAKKAIRLVSSLDQFMTHKLQITDNSGQVLLHLTRPRKVIKSTVIVEDAAGNEIGKIVQQKAIGKINFGLEANGQMLGSIKGENWRAWNFRIEDAQGTEVARISKTFEGFAKTMFTTADNYVVQIHQRMPEPLNTLIVASALSIDTALKQDSRGFG
ncbi:phospholipid scramblase-related protein [uncultured Ilumatobacter sp.]|jgi:uncharacterized protein YxjI|uniref:phospholipid scramblase-related protein n=1 Tax=uncultured Ilumatobacter sp. TaxID=879968 RepID=UPI00374EA2E6